MSIASFSPMSQQFSYNDAGLAGHNPLHITQQLTPQIETCLRQFLSYMACGGHLQQAIVGVLLGFVGLKIARATAVTTVLVAVVLTLMEWQGHITVNWKSISENAKDSSAQLIMWMDQHNVCSLSMRWLTQWSFIGGLLVGATFS